MKMGKWVLLSGFCFFLGLAPASGQSRGVFIDSESNVREKPAKDAKIILQSTKGVTFDILDNSGKWYKIKLADSTIGWTNKINIEFLKDPKPASIPNSPSDLEKKPELKTPETAHRVSIPVAGDLAEAEVSRWASKVAASPKDPVALFMLGVAYKDAGKPALAGKQIDLLKPVNPGLADDLARMLGPAK